MKLSPIFKLREKVTPEIIALLEQTTLGTNGAMYRHMDTGQRIHEADSPLFLSVERNDKVIGNLTFCRRDQDWYIRYFAFHSIAQAGEKKKTKDKGNSILKKEVNTFFNDHLCAPTDQGKVRSFYAYIDPKNDRSKWMSENFGFHVIRQLTTQSFSRINPKQSKRLKQIDNWESIKTMVLENYGNHGYFFTHHAEKPPFYCLEDTNGNILACAKVTKVNWEIIRLPGKSGAFLTKIIPFIPGLNKLIKPNNHTFLVPEIVCAKNNDPLLLEELFASILAQEKLNLMLWWIDSEDPIYLQNKNKINWGLLHRLIGSTPVDVVQRTADNEPMFHDRPVFVTAWDMV
jgi:hypothetical protein